jgi:nitroreductase
MDISVKSLFENGRTCTNFASKAVPRSLLEDIYNLAKMGPTSANTCPMRIVLVQSADARKKLLSCVMPGNVAAVESAPVTALFAYDERFTDKMPILFPQNPGMAEYFKNPKVGLDTAMRNATLQAAYFMIVARSKGLACGPMSGFDSIKLETTFFQGTHWKANFICNLGYPQGEPKYPRLPRLGFDDVCRVV